MSYKSDMARGKQTRVVSPDRIEKLSKFRVAHGYSLPQLKLAMMAPFGWETLKKALGGVSVWDVHHSYIVQWIDRYLAAPETPVDGKTAAAGASREDDAEETTKATGTLRGDVSR